MINQELLIYINQQTNQGVSKETIVGSLISQGWQQQDVDNAFTQASTEDQNVLNQAPKPTIEKKYNLPGVVIHILMRGGIVMIPVYLIVMMIAGIILTKTGVDMKSLTQRISTDRDFANQIKIFYQVIYFVLFPVSYFGIRWGCKYVSKKDHIEIKDFGKIGYWVGFVPIISLIMSKNLVVGPIFFGIFVTPVLVKKWLNEFQNKKITIKSE